MPVIQEWIDDGMEHQTPPSSENFQSRFVSFARAKGRDQSLTRSVSYLKQSHFLAGGLPFQVLHGAPVSVVDSCD